MVSQDDRRSVITDPAPFPRLFQVSVWREARTAPDASQAKQFFTVTHPFHPWRGQRFELIDCRRRWD
ncbi:MAG: DUF5372 family protein, partial [Limisphaerales bacterium]